MKRMVLQIFRSVVTIVVVGTMAVMIFSLREENAKLRKRVTAAPASAVEKDGVYVLCRFDLKPDADIADYVSKTLSIVPTVRAENGCQMYTLLKDAQTDWEKPMRFGERTLWMIEKWDSIEALKAHINAPHMKAFGPTVRPMRSSGTFHVLQEVR
jgi:quinol monooxygenase YgiN